MKLLILTHTEIEQLLPMRACIEVMAEALTALARGDVHQPQRMIVRPPAAAGLMALMPVHRSGSTAAYGLKAICVFPDNPARGLDAHQGGVLLFDGETGELLALMNASAITAIRTAATSGVATRLLARTDAHELAIIGAGVQARTHLAALACVRAIRRARVVSRNSEHARQLVAEMQPQFSFPVEAVASVEAAVRDADLIVTATSAREPVLRHEWIAAGAHINAVGTYSPAAREIDSATMAAASLFVDRREATMIEAGDYVLALAEGAITSEHIRAEIGEVLTGAQQGRTSAAEITLFKSLGLAVEDLAVAEYLYNQARAQGAGTWVEF
ncbi:MAG: ornithine cyclodeaminase [Acidobacteria bacterium]|nr:MAG: ornithine cyclodeaminase [Acidobacteriota bacterium]